MIKILLFILSISLHVSATKINATCDSASIAQALSAMVNGDTVKISAGACTTSGTFTFNKYGWLHGESSVLTKIYKTNNGNLINFNPPTSGNSKISDILLSGNNGQFLINIQSTTSNRWLVQNCIFRSNDTATYSSIGVMLYSVASYGCISKCVFRSSRVNIYDIWSSWKRGANIGTDSMVYIENCKFQRFVTTGAGNAVDANYGGRYCLRYDTFINTNIEMHSFQESFADDSAYQSNDTVYAKTGHFTSANRYVFFGATLDTIINILTNKIAIVSKTVSIGRSDSLCGIATNINNIRRGTRYYEVYNNVFYNDNAPAELVWAVRPRAGTGAVYNNQVIDLGGARKYPVFGNLDNSRSSLPVGTYTFVSQTCDGNNPIDGNTPGMEGWPALDQIGRGIDHGADSSNHHPQDSVPLYVWNNTFYGVENAPMVIYANRRDSLHIVLGRDVIFSERPNNVAFQYPHPNTVFYKNNIVAITFKR